MLNINDFFGSVEWYVLHVYLSKYIFIYNFFCMFNVNDSMMRSMHDIQITKTCIQLFVVITLCVFLCDMFVIWWNDLIIA